MSNRLDSVQDIIIQFYCGLKWIYKGVKDFSLVCSSSSGGGLEILHQPFDHPWELLWSRERDHIDWFHERTIQSILLNLSGGALIRS